MRSRDDVHAWILELQQQLHLVHAGIAVAISALRYQNSEQDVEIANVLDFFVSPRVDQQIERVAHLLRSKALGADKVGEPAPCYLIARATKPAWR